MIKICTESMEPFHKNCKVLVKLQQIIKASQSNPKWQKWLLYNFLVEVDCFDLKYRKPLS